MSPQVKPGLWWLLLAAVLMVGGTAIGFGILIDRIRSEMGSQELRFLAPATVSVTVEEPGTYVLWHDHRATFESRIYHNRASLPGGTRIELSHNGVLVTPARSWNANVQIGDHEKSEVARYRLEYPGKYDLTVSGFSDERVMSLSQPDVQGWVRAIVLFLFFNALAWIAGPAIFIVVFVLRSQNRRRMTTG